MAIVRANRAWRSCTKCVKCVHITITMKMLHLHRGGDPQLVYQQVAGRSVEEVVYGESGLPYVNKMCPTLVVRLRAPKITRSARCSTQQHIHRYTEHPDTR